MRKLICQEGKKKQKIESVYEIITCNLKRLNFQIICLANLLTHISTQIDSSRSSVSCNVRVTNTLSQPMWEYFNKKLRIKNIRFSQCYKILCLQFKFFLSHVLFCVKGNCCLQNCFVSFSQKIFCEITCSNHPNVPPSRCNQ